MAEVEVIKAVDGPILRRRDYEGNPLVITRQRVTLMGTLAQNEVESTSKNVKMGIKMKMKRGELMGFNGCLGYDYHPEDKTITVNEAEAETVRLIFELYLQGYGTYTIARRLTELGSRKLAESKGECIMCKIIAIANQKGGVGKTTTTSNLGIGLAKQGKRVLLIDADAQGSLTASLGFTEPDKLEETLATVMANIINDVEMEDDYGILRHEEGIDLMPGNIELSGLEVSLVNVMSRELVMRSYIEQVKERYDYILIDCMPSLGMITINAFACADSILIPVQAAYLPVKGLEQLIKTIGKVKRQINPKLSIEGILLTMVDCRTNYAKDISALLIENYGSKVRIFENSIPISVRAAEISAEGVSIYQHDPKGKVASAYQSLTEEVLGNE